MADVFAEVDEALRQERLEKFWAQHGTLVLAFIIATIVGTAIVSGYRTWNERVETKQTGLLLEALEAGDIAAGLEQASAEMRPGLRGIALLSAGGTLLTEGNNEAALALFEKAAQDTAIPAELRDLATLMRTRLIAQEEGVGEKREALLSDLKTIWSNEKSPWRFHARLEAAVIEAHFAQDYTKALEHLNLILTEQNLPDSLKAKAVALKHVYTLKNSENAEKESSESAEAKGEG